MSETAWMFAAVAFYSPAAILFFLSILIGLIEMVTNKEAKTIAVTIIFLLSVVFGTFCLVQWAKVPQGEKIEAVCE